MKKFPLPKKMAGKKVKDDCQRNFLMEALQLNNPLT